jgi:hypothetical protein
MLKSVKDQYRTTEHHDNVQHLVHFKSDPVRFNSEAADAAADLKFSGGYKLRRDNLCTECNTYKSVNGSCLCD